MINKPKKKEYIFEHIDFNFNIKKTIMKLVKQLVHSHY
jgi:hypothetical protein